MTILSKEKINNLLELIKKYSSYKYKKDLVNYIKTTKYFPFDEDTFVDVIKIIIENNISFNDNINKIEDLYNMLMIDKNKNNYEIFLKLIPIYTSKSIVINNKKISIICNLFENKKYFIHILELLPIGEEFNLLYNYMLESRKYYVDEIAFYANIINILDQINSKELVEFNLEKSLNDHLKEDKLLAGIPMNEEEKIEEFTQKYDELLKKYNELANLKQTKEIVYVEKNNELENTNLIKENKIEEIDQSMLINLQLIIKQIINKILDEKLILSDKNKVELTNNIISKNIINLLNNKTSKDLSNDELNNLVYKYWAVYNDNLDIYNIMFSTTSFTDFNYLKLLDKNVTDLFDKKVYMNLISEKNDMLIEYMENNCINLLSDLIRFNPSFNDRYEEKSNCFYTFSKYEVIQKIIEIFGIEKVALCEENFVKLVNEECYGEFKDLDFYKKICDINPNFSLEYTNIVFDNYLYNEEEIAYFDLKKQQILSHVIEKYYSRYPKPFNKDINCMKHIIEYLSEIDKEFYVDDNLEYLNTYKIPIEKYCRLDKDSQKELMDEFKKIANNYDIINTKQKIRQIKKKMK